MLPAVKVRLGRTPVAPVLSDTFLQTENSYCFSRHTCFRECMHVARSGMGSVRAGVALRGSAAPERRNPDELLRNGHE